MSEKSKMHFSNPLLWIAIFLFSVLVRQGDASADPEYQVSDEGAVFEESLDEKIESFLNSKNWQLGKNTKKNGQSFFLAQGVATILGMASTKSFIASRQNAFGSAMLNAKKEMVQFLSQEIEASMKSRVEEPSAERENARIADLTREGMELQAAKEIAAAMTQDAASQSETSNTQLAMNMTGERLANAEIDKELRKLGLDPSQPIEGQEIERILASTNFQRNIANIAKERLAGVMAYKTFERVSYDKQGEIGVLVIHSDRLHAVANALFSGDTNFVPAVTPKAPLKEQIPKTIAGLISTFGAQIRTDENGQLAVIAYAQSAPRTGSTSSMNTAMKKARQIAMAEIRFFAGEIVATTENSQSSESADEYNKTFNYELDDSYAESVEATAASLTIKGISTLKRWQGEHPLTKQPIAGVVVSWSPSSADFAAEQREKMQEVPTSAPEEPDPTPQPTAGSAEPAQPLEGSYEGEGAAPSDDDF